jgi:hypothetical protein
VASRIVRGHPVWERGARAQGQRRGPASRLSTPPYATPEVRLRPPSSGTPRRNGGTPLHTACSVRRNAFHIRQHRGHKRGHRPRRPRPRVASHGSDSLSRPSRVPSSRGTSERNLPSRSCRYSRPRSASTPAHRRTGSDAILIDLVCHLASSRKAPPTRSRMSRIRPCSQAYGSRHRVEVGPGGELAHSHRRMHEFVARSSCERRRCHCSTSANDVPFPRRGVRPNHPWRTGWTGPRTAFDARPGESSIDWN